MGAITITNFSGLSPRTGPTMLGNEQAQQAQNVKLQSGELRSWAKPVEIYTPANVPLSIYKLKRQSDGASVWCTWTADTDVVQGPIADLADNRIYYMDGVLPKKTNYALATTGTGAYPRTAYNLKVPPPASAPTVLVAVQSSLSAVYLIGSATTNLPITTTSYLTETRSYVYTYVATFGAVSEESAPSPATLVTCNTTDMTVRISGFATAGTTAQGYNITGIRIYRSVSGTQGLAYLLVDQIAVTPADGVVVAAGTSTYGVAYTGSSYPDTYPASSVSSTTLPSLNWTVPPDDLKGLVSLPNGMMAAFRNNEVYFCEPYYPHAWPIAYMLTTEFPIVGLAVFGSTLGVLTTKNPYLISGTHPAAMTQEKLALLQPCVSKRSIAYDQHGVLYASPNGLVSISPGAQEVITTPLYTRDEWQGLAPDTMMGLIYNNYYIGFYRAPGDVYGALVMARGDSPPLVYYDFPATAVFVEHLTGAIFAVSNDDDKIYQLDAHSTDNTTYEWKSKQYILGGPTNFACLQANADFDYLNNSAAINDARAVVAASNLMIWNDAATNSTSLLGDMNASDKDGTGGDGILVNEYMLNGSSLAAVPNAADNRSINALVYADGVLVFSTGIADMEPKRLPALSKNYRWEVKFTGNAPLRSFSMATSIPELGGV